jgi:hypothetical protein
MSAIDCFVCAPGAPPPLERPWYWTSPRAMCLAHKSDLRLEDGQPLRDVLARVAPPDQPLEGGPLAWIFNPVFARASDGRALRGWTAFAAGGMAVFEDRFGATSYFEACAFQAPNALDVLYALRETAESPFHPDLAPALSRSRDRFQALLAVYQAAPAAQDRYVSAEYGVAGGVAFLMRTWNQQVRLQQIRQERGRLWPESYDDLLEWIEHCGRGAQEQVSREQPFFPTLFNLAQRRFPRAAECAAPAVD